MKMAKLQPLNVYPLSLSNVMCRNFGTPKNNLPFGTNGNFFLFSGVQIFKHIIVIC